MDEEGSGVKWPWYRDGKREGESGREEERGGVGGGGVFLQSAFPGRESM